MASYIEGFGIESRIAQPNVFDRTRAFPLDRSSMFSSYADAVEYAKGLYQGEGDRRPKAHDSRLLAKASYIGQIITVYENNTVQVYKIDFDRTLKLIGGADVDAGTYGE